MLHHFRNTSIKMMETEKTKLWKELLATKTPLPALKINTYNEDGTLLLSQQGDTHSTYKQKPQYHTSHKHLAVPTRRASL